MSTDSTFASSPIRKIPSAVLVLKTQGFPAPRHPAEPDLYCRQAGMPGHSQAQISRAHVGVVGAGGLGGWIATGLARAGVSRLTIVDPDFFDRTNAPRQLMFGLDIGEPKAHALAGNVVPHMTNEGTVTGIALPLQAALPAIDGPPDVMVVGVDNDAARIFASEWGLENHRPVVFAMLSLDGLRAQVFSQLPGYACLRCVLPNVDADDHTPCAAASAASCQLAAAHALHMTISALSGAATAPTWRQTSLDGTTERTGNPPRESTCASCSKQ